jgi:hypothetical protein
MQIHKMEDTNYALNVKREQKVAIMNRRQWRRGKIQPLNPLHQQEQNACN